MTYIVNNVGEYIQGHHPLLHIGTSGQQENFLQAVTCTLQAKIRLYQDIWGLIQISHCNRINQWQQQWVDCDIKALFATTIKISWGPLYKTQILQARYYILTNTLPQVLCHDDAIPCELVSLHLHWLCFLWSQTLQAYQSEKYKSWIPWKLVLPSRFISRKTHFLILAGSAFYQIWLGRGPNMIRVVNRIH